MDAEVYSAKLVSTAQNLSEWQFVNCNACWCKPIPGLEPTEKNNPFINFINVGGNNV